MKTRLFCILLAAFAIYSIAADGAAFASNSISAHTAKINSI